jgi:hypothetical protein
MPFSNPPATSGTTFISLCLPHTSYNHTYTHSQAVDYCLNKKCNRALPIFLGTTVSSPNKVLFPLEKVWGDREGEKRRAGDIERDFCTLDEH